MNLTRPDNNPMPPNPQTGFVETHDSIKLRYARWKTTNPPCKGTVLILGGRTEYIEKYYETITFLRKRGFDILAFDWRGQGGSSRMIEDPRRGFVESFDQYIVDLETIISNVALPDCRAPFFILGHSTGSLVALLAAPQLNSQIQRMVLGSPMLALSSVPVSQNLLKFLTGAMHVMGLGKTYLSGGPSPEENRAFSGNRLTSDEIRFRRNADFTGNFRDLTIGGPTASWLFAACHAMDTLNHPDFVSQILIPTLLICAGNDSVVDNRATERLGRRMRSGKTFTIPGARHELLQEKDVYREQFLAAFLSFAPGGAPLTKDQ